MGGAPADKPARLVAAGDALVVARGRHATWGQSGRVQAFDAALTRWDIAVEGRRCLDAGASTGGFTDVLLSRGAAEVWVVDVGRGQLLERLRRDPRVVPRDRTNIRLSTAPDLGGGGFEVVVADLSFISLRTTWRPVLAGDLAAPGADLVWLVKPQFEAGREAVAAGRGVVRDPTVWRDALVGVGHALVSHGAAIMGVMTSPLRGADGNVEFLVWARAATPSTGFDIDAMVAGALSEVDAR